MRYALTLFDGDEDDFVRSVLNSDDWSVVAEAFAAVPQHPWEYAEPTTVARAVLAAELLVAQKGDAPGDFPDDLLGWARERNDPDSDLIRRASRALRRAAQATETTDDWKDDDAARGELRRRAGSLLRLLD